MSYPNPPDSRLCEPGGKVPGWEGERLWLSLWLEVRWGWGQGAERPKLFSTTATTQTNTNIKAKINKNDDETRTNTLEALFRL